MLEIEAFCELCIEITSIVFFVQGVKVTWVLVVHLAQKEKRYSIYLVCSQENPENLCSDFSLILFNSQNVILLKLAKGYYV